MTALQIVVTVETDDVPAEITATLAALPDRYGQARYFSIAFLAGGIALDDEGCPLLDPAPPG